MEAVNAGFLSPLSVLAKNTQPRKCFSVASIPQMKSPSFPNFRIPENLLSVSRKLEFGMVALSSIMNSQFAEALTYDEALQQSVSSSGSDSDIGGVLGNVIGFVGDNPLIIGGGLVALAVPLVVSQLFSKPKPWGVDSAKNAYAKLADDANAQLLDIRAPLDIKQVGSPDIRVLKKKPVTIVYNGEDKPGFLNKLSLKFKEPENTTLFVLDKFDGNSELVAELVTVNGFKAAYAIKDGAEGQRGWKNSGLPWITPKKSVGFDLSGLTDFFGDAADVVPVALGAAAAGALGFLTYTEVEAILQVLGFVGLFQFVSKKLLTKEDRKKTLQQIDEVFNNEVGVKDLGGDILQIGKALLPPVIINTKTLSAPAEAPSPANVVQISESLPEVNNTPPKVEAATEVKSVLPRPLSPYPNYPDFKPPTSPIPSQP